MDSIVRVRAIQRLEYVTDTTVSAQGLEKSIKEHRKALSKVADIQTDAGSQDDFLKQLGRG